MLVSPFSVPVAKATVPEKSCFQSVGMPQTTPSVSIFNRYNNLTNLALPNSMEVESFNNHKGITKTEVELLITEAIRAHEFRTTVHAIFMIVVVYTAGFVSAFFLFLSQWTGHHS